MGLSVVVITKNEAFNLTQCLASVTFADELVVVDSGSTDNTVQIAQSFDARILQTSDWPGFGIQKNRAVDLSTHEWILSIDADERIGPDLREEILQAIAAPSHTVYALNRRSSYCGQTMNHSGWYPDPVVRLFKRGAARFSDDLVHESLRTSAPIGMLHGAMPHLSFRDLESVLDKVNRYSTAGAQSLAMKGKHASLGKALLHGFWAFFRTFIVRRGFLDGRMGLVLAISNAEGTYYRYLKLWLMQHPPTKKEPC
jgi:glycosyltransferase involved in cell wall biosynthesis